MPAPRPSRALPPPAPRGKYRRGRQTAPSRSHPPALLAPLPPPRPAGPHAPPAQPLFGFLDLLSAERAAMRPRRPGFVRRAERDNGLASDQARSVMRLRSADRGGDLVVVEAIDMFGVPAMRAEPLDLIVGDREV